MVHLDFEVRLEEHWLITGIGRTRSFSTSRLQLIRIHRLQGFEIQDTRYNAELPQRQRFPKMSRSIKCIGTSTCTVQEFQGLGGHAWIGGSIINTLVARALETTSSWRWRRGARIHHSVDAVHVADLRICETETSGTFGAYNMANVYALACSVRGLGLTMMVLSLR
jgi:hypothetical protein